MTLGSMFELIYSAVGLCSVNRYG